MPASQSDCSLSFAPNSPWQLRREMAQPEPAMAKDTYARCCVYCSFDNIVILQFRCSLSFDKTTSANVACNEMDGGARQLGERGTIKKRRNQSIMNNGFRRAHGPTCSKDHEGSRAGGGDSCLVALLGFFGQSKCSVEKRQPLQSRIEKCDGLADHKLSARVLHIYPQRHRKHIQFTTAAQISHVIQRAAKTDREKKKSKHRSTLGSNRSNTLSQRYSPRNAACRVLSTLCRLRKREKMNACLL